MTTTAFAQSKMDTVEHVNTGRLILGIILGALSGVLFLLSFPPYGLWPLAWIALAPCVLAQHRLLPRKWSSLAPSMMALFWLGPYLARLFGNEAGPFFTYLGVFIALLNLVLSTERKFHELTQYRWFVAFGVLAWVGFEMIRATIIPLIATSAFIGYTQSTQPWMIQPVSIFSVYGLNMVIMLVNCAIGQAVLAWYDRRQTADGFVAVDQRSTRRWLAVAGGVLTAWIGIGLVLLNAAPKDANTVRVAALQSGYPLPAFQDKVNTAAVRVETFSEQARAAAQQGAKILYSSEMMFDFDPQQEYTGEFRSLAKETGAYIFITYAVAREGEPFRNQAVLLSPAGEFSEVYSKNHIPPGEPASPVIGKYPVYDTSLGRLASMICHDANYTDVARKLTRNGAQLVAAAFREFAGFGEQLWTNVTFRAVENHTAMVVTGANTVSAIIDPYGRQVALQVNKAGEQVTLVGDVALGSGGTLYTTLGDWLGWLSLAGYIALMVFQSVSERKFKKAADVR